MTYYANAPPPVPSSAAPNKLLAAVQNQQNGLLDYEFEQAPPPTVDDEIHRKEEEELQRVLEMSMQDQGNHSPKLQPEAEPAPEPPGVYGLGPGQTAPDSPPAPPSLASYTGFSGPSNVLAATMLMQTIYRAFRGLAKGRYQTY